MNVRMNPSWRDVLCAEFDKLYWQQLTAYVRREYSESVCYPPGRLIFSAFDLTPFDQVRVVILGQDPYHGYGQAHGLCFSVPEGVAPPPSLRNIFKEIVDDLSPTSQWLSEQTQRGSTNLTRWANQGVLLLNSVLTVRASQAASHQGLGWETFTDAAIKALAEQRENLVFMLWGAYAQRKGAMIDPARHLILRAPHPSPLSAHQGFFGQHHFSTCNTYLQEHKQKPIIW